MRILLTFLLSLSLAVPAIAQTQYRTFPDDPTNLHHATLKNGMEVYLLEDNRQSDVYGGVVIKAGGKYDPADATGMGHYLEHMLFKGTQSLGTKDYMAEKVHLDKITELYEELGQTTEEEKRSQIQLQINQESVAAAEYAIPNEFDRLLQSIGSRGLNAFTAEEMIMYHNYFPANQMEKWLDIYAERFTNPVFRLFQSELETVYEEKNRAMDDFVFPLINAFNKNFYKVHPYGQQTIIGETEHLKNPSLTKMYDYFDTYYVANNMALVLCGNFDAEKVFPMVEEKFGVLRSGDVPDYPEYPEEPFKGRESIKVRYTPIAVGIAGYRAPAEQHPDETAFQVVAYLMSNQGETGLLDRLNLDRKILGAGFEYTPQLDHGAVQIFFAPKLIGQSLKKAEELVMAEIARIKTGDFEDWQLEAAKMALQREYAENLERAGSKAMMAAQAFVSGTEWEEVLSFPERVDAITREDIMAVGEKYLGDNYFMLESKMGFPKKQKLDKPGYEAPEPGPETQSAYAQKFNSMSEGQPAGDFIDFQKDLKEFDLGPSTLYHVDNTTNELFQLTFRFRWGTFQDRRLTAATSYLSLVGTDSLAINELKRAFSQLGATYYISNSTGYTEIELKGFDNQLEECVELLAHFIERFEVKEEVMKMVEDEIKTERKVNRKDVSAVGQALRDHIRYGEETSYQARLGLKEIKKMAPDSLVAAFRRALAYQADVHYFGNTPADEVHRLVERFMDRTGAGSIATDHHARAPKAYSAPTVFFIPRKDAIQSQVYFYRHGPSHNAETYPAQMAFNEYFGASMSSLVFQEIRELRSLAYSTRAYLASPVDKPGSLHFWGYIGCQGDKTPEALSTMYNLITEMPEKNDRLVGIKKALTQKAYSSRPGDRGLSQQVAFLKRQGYTSDPYATWVNYFDGLEWKDLVQVYEQAVLPSEDAPLVIGVVGDPKRISEEELSKYGTVIKLDESDVWRE